MNRAYHTIAHLHIAAAFGAAVALAPAICLAGPPSTTMDFFWCANEHGTCTLASLGSSTFLVAYGDYTNGRWAFYNVSGSFPCETATFGGPDPDWGTPKTCLFAPYSFTGVEGSPINLQSATEVAYGANGSYVYKTVGGLCLGNGPCPDDKCDTNTFGVDPAPFVQKECFLPLVQYQFANGEGGGVHIDVPNTPVAYGAHGYFKYQTLDSDATCSTQTFGGRDPSPGNVKTCYRLNVDGLITTEGQLYGGGGAENIFYGSALVPNFLSVYFAGQPGGGVAGECSNSFFGGDPAVGYPKSCWGSPLAPPPVNPP
jgi:hypothetical protein